jgi:hypothetical protein
VIEHEVDLSNMRAMLHITVFLRVVNADINAYCEHFHSAPALMGPRVA